MADNKREYLKFITPRVVVKYPRLIKPDTGPKGKESAPKFTVKGIFTPGEGEFIIGKTKVSYEGIVEKLEAIRDEEFERVMADAKAKKKGALIKKLHKAPVFKQVLDDEGNETAEVEVYAKTAATYKDKGTGEVLNKRPPLMFDSKGKKIEGKLPAVGGGSTMKIAVSAAAYFVESSGAVGITCYLDSTQLIKLVEFGGGGTNPGFDSEDDGYEAEDAPASFGDEGGDGAESGDDF
jgi:hypothetical protein